MEHSGVQKMATPGKKILSEQKIMEKFPRQIQQKFQTGRENEAWISLAHLVQEIIILKFKLQKKKTSFCRKLQQRWALTNPIKSWSWCIAEAEALAIRLELII